MEIVILIFAWVFLGFIGSALALEFGFRRDGLDITSDDIWFGACIGVICGPGGVFIGLIYFIGWLLPKGGRPSRVIFKAKRK